MAVQLWKDGKNGPEMVLIEPEIFNMSFLEHGYRFTEEPEQTKEEEDKDLETDEDTEEEPVGAEERETNEEPWIKEEVLKRPYNKRR